MEKRLRYADLKAAGIVNNRATLGEWIRKGIFPPGQLTGPNTRTWGEDTEVKPFIASRPTARKPAPKSPGRPRKADRCPATPTP
jgi:hypothetical protein